MLCLLCCVVSTQALVNDKGYTFLDIRTGKEYRSGNGLHWHAPPSWPLSSPYPSSPFGSHTHTHACAVARRPQDVAAPCGAGRG